MTDCGFWYSFGWYVCGMVTPFAVVVLVGVFWPEKWMIN